MEEIKKLINTFQFTNEIWMIFLPIILMAIDIITGFINAWVKGEVKSSILRKGIAKKIGEMSIILIGELFVLGLGLPIGTGISLYIMIMEMISICENLEKLGVPIPNFISKALASTVDKIQIDKEDDTNESEKKN